MRLVLTVQCVLFQSICFKSSALGTLKISTRSSSTFLTLWELAGLLINIFWEKDQSRPPKHVAIKLQIQKTNIDDVHVFEPMAAECWRRQIHWAWIINIFLALPHNQSFYHSRQGGAILLLRYSMINILPTPNKSCQVQLVHTASFIECKFVIL